MAEPRYFTPPNPDRKNELEVRRKIAASLNTPFMPSQELINRVASEKDPETGHNWYSTIIITMPRQSGKTTSIATDALTVGLTNPGSRCFYTAQKGLYASQFMRDELGPKVLDIPVYAKRMSLDLRGGAESLKYANNSYFRAFPPRKDALHSKTAHRVYVDEAWAFDYEKGQNLKQAIRPTMVTVPGSQLWVLSTMGDDTSVYWNDYVELGRASTKDPESRVAYFEWSIPEGSDPEDLDLIAKHHPAYGYTVTMEALIAARKDFGRDVGGWARAYGNRPSFAVDSIFPETDWLACVKPLPINTPKPTRLAFGFDVSPDGSKGSIAAAWRDAKGNPVIEVAHDRKGFDWMPDAINAMKMKFNLPPGAIAHDSMGLYTLKVASDAKIKYPRLTTPAMKALSTAEFGMACSTVTAAVFGQTLTHYDQVPLNDAVRVATRRPIFDGGFAFGRKGSSGSIAPLVAAAAALQAYDMLPKERDLRVLTAR